MIVSKLFSCITRIFKISPYRFVTQLENYSSCFPVECKNPKCPNKQSPTVQEEDCPKQKAACCAANSSSCAAPLPKLENIKALKLCNAGPKASKSTCGESKCDRKSRSPKKCNSSPSASRTKSPKKSCSPANKPSKPALAKDKHIIEIYKSLTCQEPFTHKKMGPCRICKGRTHCSCRPPPKYIKYAKFAKSAKSLTKKSQGSCSSRTGSRKSLCKKRSRGTSQLSIKGSSSGKSMSSYKQTITCGSKTCPNCIGVRKYGTSAGCKNKPGSSCKVCKKGGSKSSCGKKSPPLPKSTCSLKKGKCSSAGSKTSCGSCGMSKCDREKNAKPRCGPKKSKPSCGKKSKSCSSMKSKRSCGQPKKTKSSCGAKSAKCKKPTCKKSSEKNPVIAGVKSEPGVLKIEVRLSSKSVPGSSPDCGVCPKPKAKCSKDCAKPSKPAVCKKPSKTCNKKPSPCGKKPSPCGKKRSSCGKKRSPCGKKSACGKKPSSAGKKSSRCGKKPSTCSKKPSRTCGKKTCGAKPSKTCSKKRSKTCGKKKSGSSVKKAHSRIGNPIKPGTSRPCLKKTSSPTCSAKAPSAKTKKPYPKAVFDKKYTGRVYPSCNSLRKKAKGSSPPTKGTKKACLLGKPKKRPCSKSTGKGSTRKSVCTKKKKAHPKAPFDKKYSGRVYPSCKSLVKKGKRSISSLSSLGNDDNFFSKNKFSSLSVAAKKRLHIRSGVDPSTPKAVCETSQSKQVFDRKYYGRVYPFVTTVQKKDSKKKLGSPTLSNRPFSANTIQNSTASRISQSPAGSEIQGCRIVRNAARTKSAGTSFHSKMCFDISDIPPNTLHSSSRKNSGCPESNCEKECDNDANEDNILCKMPHIFREIDKCEKTEIDEYFDSYNNKEYYYFGKNTFADLMRQMQDCRLPQPSNKSQEKECK